MPPTLTPTPRGRHHAPMQPPGVVPDYEHFCRVAMKHRHTWSLTYDDRAPLPYAAQSTHTPRLMYRAASIDALEATLHGYTPPPPTRTATSAEQAAAYEEMADLAALVRQLLNR